MVESAEVRHRAVRMFFSCAMLWPMYCREEKAKRRLAVGVAGAKSLATCWPKQDTQARQIRFRTALLEPAEIVAANACGVWLHSYSIPPKPLQE